MSDNDFLKLAILKAKESIAAGGFPAGAVVAKDGKIVGEGISIGNKLNDPMSHGEMASMRTACANLKTPDLSGATLYASMHPCVMCLGAAMWSSISKIVFACPKEKVSDEYYGGHYDPSAINAAFNHPLELVHVAELEGESLAVVHAWEQSL